MNLFDLAARITLNTADYEKGLDEASNKTSSFADKLKNGLATAAKVGAAAITAVTTATAAMTAAVIKGVSDVASYGDNIDKMSQKMGLSAEAYQEWDAIMQHSGTSIESLQAGMKTLANAVENGNKAFERLGLSQEEIALMSNEELFSATITALQNVDNETERTYLAGQLLGRGATELGALLNMSAEETEAMRKRVHELGGVMSDEAVKAAAAYQDSLQDTKTAFSGLSRNMLSEFLPSITSVMDGLTEVFAGNDEKGLGLVSSGISEFVDNLTQSIPRILEIGSKIVTSLAASIVDNLPALLSAGMDVLGTLGRGIIDNIPIILDSALEIIMSLSNGLSEALPELIPAVISTILQIAETLTDPDNLLMLVNAAIEIALAIGEGLVNSLPILIEKAPIIISNLVQALSEAAPKLLDAGLELITTLGQGLLDNFPILQDVWDGLTEGFSKVWSFIQDIWDNVSPYFESLWENVKNAFSLTADVLTTLFEKAWQAIKIIWDVVEPYFSNLWQQIKNVFSVVAEVLGSFFSTAWENIMLIWDASIDFFSTIWENIKLIFSVVSDVLSGDFGSAWEKIKQIFENWGEFFSGLWDNVKEIFANVWEFFTDVGSNIVEGIKQGISNAWSGITNWFSDKFNDLVGGVKDFLGIHSPSTVFASIGRNMALGLQDGWGDSIDSINKDIIRDLDFKGDIGVSYNQTQGQGMYNGQSSRLSIVQNIYSQAKTAADLMEEAMWNAEMAVLRGV